MEGLHIEFYQYIPSLCRCPYSQNRDVINGVKLGHSSGGNCSAVITLKIPNDPHGPEMVFTPEVEDFLLDLNRRSVRMPFWDWWAVYETIFAILLVGLTPAIKASPANPKITACLCYMPGLLSVSKNA